MDLTAGAALARTLLLTRQQRLPDVGDDDLLAGLVNTSVCIVSDEPNLFSPSGQAMVSTLAGLVFAMGMNVRLVLPAVAMAGYQPPLRGDEFRAAVVRLGADSVPGAAAQIVESAGGADIVFVVGDSPWNGDGNLAWRLSAGPWSGSMVPAMEAGRRVRGTFPIGALAIAATAAAEPYRAALRSIATRNGCIVPEPTQLDPAIRIHLRLAPNDAPSPDELDLGAVDVVSGGAITTAAMHVLLRLPGVTAAVRLWEPELLDVSNLNRYLLMLRTMVGRPKVEMLEHWGHHGFDIDGHRQLVDESALPRIGPWASQVMVGTDNTEARLLVQRTWPAWLVVAGTAGFMAMVSEHEPGQPCAGCLHSWTESVLGDVPTISFVSYWAGLLAATRLVRQRLLGRVLPAEQMTVMWADRLDSATAFMPGPVGRTPGCRVGCI
jgi:hypothetical protein